MRHDLIEPLEVPALPRLGVLALDGRTVAEYVDGAALPRELAPRPFLHPVRTAAGVVVTDRCPPDHRWHLGVGVAVQDVAGRNLWGGRTYVRDEGYVWRADHGSMRHVDVRPVAAPGGGCALLARLAWLGPDGEPLLHETRRMAAWWLPGPARVWVLDLDVRLEAATAGAVDLGSPATNGRPGGGYGGLFWRLPELSRARVLTPDAEGEDAVHGRTADWLAVGGLVGGLVGGEVDGEVDGGAGGAAVTLVAVQPRAGDAPPDPWFVRLAGYPGFGPSLAADRPVTVRPGAPLERGLRVAVADGAVDPFVLGTTLRAAGRERMAP